MATSASRTLAVALAPLEQSFVRKRFMIGIALGVLAILSRWMLDGLLGHSAFYPTLYVAVLASALTCGLVPSVLTALTGFTGILYWFVDTRQAFLVTEREDINTSIGCLFVCAALITLGEVNRKKQLRLNESHSELEQRVDERTCELAKEIEVRRNAERELRILSLRLMAVQDEERRRIARDLHDSAGQLLAAIKMAIASLRQPGRTLADISRITDEMDNLSDEAIREIRTTSYLLHPPMLDERGLVSATEWFLNGYSGRSGVKAELTAVSDLGRFPSKVELALFRVLQEGLTNAHRHAKCSIVDVDLRLGVHELVLEIHDNGQGFSPEGLAAFRNSKPTTSVGLAGMRERLRELGGRLEIESGKSGTLLRAIVPVSALRQADVAQTTASSAVGS
jgi:signal transduction histidine kinase